MNHATAGRKDILRRYGLERWRWLWSRGGGAHPQVAARRGSPTLSVDGPDMAAALLAFRQAYPTFDRTSRLDELRATEYGRLDAQGHIYLDYTGGGLYADSQLRQHMNLLRRNVFGNPHSNSPASRAMTDLAEHARTSVLEYFNASPDEYAVVFTANASGALKLVGESYPFTSNGHLLLAFDNHNSVNGIREFARAKGATTTYLPTVPPELCLDETQVAGYLDQATLGASNLFAYPAQSNFSGVQHSLEWVAQAQAKGWDVLVDCAAFVPTNRLDLSRWHPDFVPLSFYKIFGYPTGVGCLIARRVALAKLRRPWFAGGTVMAVTVQGDGYYMAEGEAAFEDGTINYLNLPAVEIGLKHVAAIGVETIHERVTCLTGWLLDNLTSLRHSNGAPLVRLYGPRTLDRRGGTIAINFLNPDGHVIDERVIDQTASERNISVRTGCFCNPGAGEVAFSLSKDALVESFVDELGMTYDEFLVALGLESAGAVRISLGVATTFTDVYRFLQYARSFLDTFPDVSNLPPRRGC